jgi:hypothetical protein
LQELPKIQSVVGSKAVPSKLPRIKSDSDIEILSSDEEENEEPQISSQENDKDTQDENDKEDMETQSDDEGKLPHLWFQYRRKLTTGAVFFFCRRGGRKRQ